MIRTWDIVIYISILARLFQGPGLGMLAILNSVMNFREFRCESSRGETICGDPSVCSRSRENRTRFRVWFKRCKPTLIPTGMPWAFYQRRHMTRPQDRALSSSPWIGMVRKRVMPDISCSEPRTHTPRYFRSMLPVNIESTALAGYWFKPYSNTWKRNSI